MWAVAACSGAEPGDVQAPEAPVAAEPGANPPAPSASVSAPTKDASVPPPADAGADRDAAPAGAVGTFGRWDTRDAKGPRAGWPGSSIRFRFRGTKAAVTLDETPGTGGPSEWDVAIDGVWRAQKLALQAGRGTYPLADGLPAKEHTIELFRRTEALSGSTQLLGVTVGEGALLPPPAPRARTFEFLGDSLTNAYGIEGTGPRCSYTASTQNLHMSFASRVAEAFGAELSVVAYQGKGLTKNYVRASSTLFPELYTRALPDDPMSLWDARKLVPDAVFVMIGANDFLQEKAQVFDPPSLPAFRAAYVSLLAKVRQNAPQAHVFAMVGPTQTDMAPARYNARTDQTAAVVQAVASRTSAGDARVHYIDLPAEPQSELTACDYHPSVGVHERIAQMLVPQVRSITGF